MKHQLLFALAQFIIDQFTAHKTLIVFIIIGMIAGLVAQLVMPGQGHGLVATALIGIAGCAVGVFFINQYITFVENHVVRELIGAIVGAAAITLLVNLITGPARKKAK